MKIAKTLKIVMINLATFMLLLMVVNWGCGIYLKKSSTVKREELPNYATDRAYARKIFADYKRVKHRYEPFVGWKMLPYTGETLHISATGQRTYKPAPFAGEKEKTVHFFGGSTMWGEGSDDAHTIPALFNAAFPQFKVYNHGQLAYNSRQELDALISLYATGAHPDIVIFYDGVNDAAFLCPKEIKELPAHRLVPMYREKLYIGKTGLAKEIADKVFTENIFKVIHKFTYKPTAENSPYNCVSNPDKAEQIAEMMMKNWELAHEIVTTRGGKFLAVLQPAAYIGHPKTDYLELDKELGKNFREIYDRVKMKIAARHHPWIIDLTDAFDGEEYIYIDFCHVSPNGNKRIADKISNAVATLNQNEDVALFAIHP